MIGRRLDPELHGSDGFTTIPRVAALAASVFVLAVGVHLGWQAWYAGRLMPGTTVANHDLGGKSLAEARHILADEAASYRLKLLVADQGYVLTASDLGVSFDTESTLVSAYASGRSSWLPVPVPTALPLSYTLDRHALADFVTKVSSQVGTEPVDATVQVTGVQLKTVPEKSGWTVDRLGLARLIERDLGSLGGGSLQVKPREQIADIQAKALVPTIDEATQLMATPLVLSYNNQTFTPTKADIGGWLSFVKQQTEATYRLIPQIDSSKLKNYVNQLANRLDVAPVNKKIIIQNGVSSVATEGVDGTAIDRDPLTAAIIDAVTNQRSLVYTITSHPVAFKTVSNTFISLDVGSYIEINLSLQHLWVWQDHNVIYDTPITSGATGAGFPTVTGLFSIYYKTTNTHLVGNQYGPRYNYDVAVKYWMPFYSGFGLHDASWRNGKFGGSDYYYGGSHGCVNLPDAAAEFIYNWSVVGTPVWVHQ